MSEKICVVGLGYVGLPLALALSAKFPHVGGFDVNASKIKSLMSGIDVTGEGYGDQLKAAKLKLSSDIQDFRDCTVFIVAVPTPVDDNKAPDLNALRMACESVAAALSKGALVVFESTVYPGLTEEECGPLLEKHSGLKSGTDFFLGYSPERMNPGDKEHTLQRIVKVVAGQDAKTLDRVAGIYSAIVDAGVYRATSIRVAEAAKVIENTQRDLNIALMNELAIIFDLMNISTKEVLDAAQSKWNFLRFSPGLVGGHCIGVDPYYLTAKASRLGYLPQVILAGRRINDGMGKYIAHKALKLMIEKKISVHQARIGVLGLTFKENVSDIRNSRVPDVVHELQEYGLKPQVHDPHVNAEEALHEYGLQLSTFEQIQDVDVLVFAVPHRWYLEKKVQELKKCVKSDGIVIDVKSAWPERPVQGNPGSVTYWSL